MPRGIRRNWFAVESSMIDHPKWSALSWSDRGKWLAVRALSERQPTGDFKDRVHLTTLLKKEGDASPGTTIDRFLTVRLLDLQADGTIAIHDVMDYLPGLSTGRVQTHRNEPKRFGRGETATDRQTYIHAGTPAQGEGAPPRERTPGESLRAFLERIGAPVPDVATKETTNGETSGAESPSDDDGASRRRKRRGPAKAE